MQKVLTAAQMREVDRLTTERYGIPSIILMENAAHAVARVITEKLGGSVRGHDAVILCGKGNNGGDGAALARYLFTQWCDVDVFLFGSIEDTNGDARTNFEIIKSLSQRQPPFYPALMLYENASWNDDLSNAISSSSVVVDALFGTGLTRHLDDSYKRIFSGINEIISQKKVRPLLCSIDIPSGLNADSTSDFEPSFRPDITVTITAPKLGNVLPPNSERNGQFFVGDIGTPYEMLLVSPSRLSLAEPVDVKGWLTKAEFTNASYKNKRGHALMIAGSRDYSGAAVLCGDAAIRSGCGLVTIATPESSRESIVARVSPEVMVRGIAETDGGSASEKAFDEIGEFSKNVDVIAVGSGLSSKEDETKRFIKRIVDEWNTPVVIDADGLTALSPWHEAMQKPAQSKGDDDIDAGEPPAVRPLILTPHEGEFRRLLGVEKDEFAEIIKDRVQAVRDFATKNNVYLVLKGERVLIGAPNGNVVVNPTGNSGLGKAGNGDTLTGILTGFIAQAVQMKINIFETIVAAVYVAGMAGDIAAKKFGKRVMTASDVRECLAEVFAEFEKR